MHVDFLENRVKAHSIVVALKGIVFLCGKWVILEQILNGNMASLSMLRSAYIFPCNAKVPIC